MTLNGTLTLDAISEFLGKLAEHSEDVYWLSSPDFERIAYISPSYETIWGRSRQELYDHPEQWITFLHPEDVKKDYHPIDAMRERVLKQGAQARYAEDYRIIRPDGEVRWIMDRGFPVLDQQGNFCGVTGVAVDVTQAKTLEQTLEKAKQDAEAANHAKTEFLMNMRHDFRTPFTGILGLADLMMMQEKDPKKKENLKFIAQAASSLLDQHNEIFEFARSEDGTLPVLEKQFNLHALLNDEANMMMPSAQAKGLDFNLDYPEDLPKSLIGDQTRIHRILMNLLSNAIKFTQQGHVKLRASVAKTEDHRIILELNIEDTGIGIPEDKQNVVYEKFTKLTHGFKSKTAGLGCGLRIVKQFMDDIGGEIHLDSTLNMGSTFRLLIPLKKSLMD